MTLLPRTQWHSVDGQVATDIELHDGTLSAGPLSGTPFNVDGHHRKDKTPILPKQYSPSVTWTAKDENDVQVEIHKVLDKQGTLVLERTVTLRPASSFSAHIYNFDNGLPTVDELKKETTVECKGRLSDHDFKWIYALMNRHPGFPKWQDWLDGEEFPTPWASCRQLKSIKLLPVSTCFQTVVDE